MGAKRGRKFSSRPRLLLKCPKSREDDGIWKKYKIR